MLQYCAALLFANGFKKMVAVSINKILILCGVCSVASPLI